MPATPDPEAGITRRALVGLAVLGAAPALGGLAGCAALSDASAQPASGASGSPATRTASADAAGPEAASAEAASAALARRLGAAVGAGDREGFLRCFTPGARTLGEVWFSAWRSFAGVELAGAPDGHLEVTWRVGEEAGTSATALPVRLLGGLVDGVDDPSPLPIWLRHLVVLARSGPVSVLAAAEVDADAWLEHARTAADRVRDAGLDGWHGWTGDVVVEIPVDSRDFDLRDAGDAGSGAAAYTVREVDHQDVVVVDPMVTRAWSDADVAGLLTHEVVHVALGVSGDRAPMWVREGVADWVAAPWWPKLRAENRAASAGAPADAELPTDADFADPDTVARAYALAEAAVAGIVAEHGRDALLAWAHDWAGAPAPSAAALTELLRAELARRR